MTDQIADGKTSVTWVAASGIADIAAPTVSELDAGTDLHFWITPDGLGIAVDESDVDTSSLGSTFSTSDAGRPSLSSNELTFKDQGKTNDPYLMFKDRIDGFVVIRPNVAVATAYAASQSVEVYPVAIGDVKHLEPAGNDLDKFSIPLSLTSDFDLDATVAA